MKKMFLVLGILVLLAGCSGSKEILLDSDVSPTTVKSPEDLPKQVMTYEEIKEKGIIRVVGESSKGQGQYEALTAAKGTAQKALLAIKKGVSLQAEELIDKGVLTKDDIRIITEGHIRTFPCGAYYDKSFGTGYYCLELPLKEK